MIAHSDVETSAYLLQMPEESVSPWKVQQDDTIEWVSKTMNAKLGFNNKYCLEKEKRLKILYNCCNADGTYEM